MTAICGDVPRITLLNDDYSKSAEQQASLQETTTVSAGTPAAGRYRAGDTQSEESAEMDDARL